MLNYSPFNPQLSSLMQGYNQGMTMPNNPYVPQYTGPGTTISPQSPMIAPYIPQYYGPGMTYSGSWDALQQNPGIPGYTVRRY